MPTNRYIETLIVRSLLAELLNAGASLSVEDYDQDGEEFIIEKSRDLDRLSAACLNVFDEVYLVVTFPDVAPGVPDPRNGWALLILGNGVDILSDYSASIENEIQRTLSFVDALNSYNAGGPQMPGALPFTPVPTGVTLNGEA